MGAERDDAVGLNAGAAYVFQRDEGGWLLGSCLSVAPALEVVERLVGSVAKEGELDATG